jgi:hypothetical protein
MSPADLRSMGMSSVLESTSPGLYTILNMIAAARSDLARSSRDQMLLGLEALCTAFQPHKSAPAAGLHLHNWPTLSQAQAACRSRCSPFLTRGNPCCRQCQWHPKAGRIQRLTECLTSFPNSQRTGTRFRGQGTISTDLTTGIRKGRFQSFSLFQRMATSRYQFS